MDHSREDRLKALFKKLTADFLKTEADTKALVTVTDVSVSKDSKNATAFITVFPDALEKEVLSHLGKKKSYLSRYLASHTKMKTIPSLRFVLDAGEKNRQKIDELLRN